MKFIFSGRGRTNIIIIKQLVSRHNVNRTKKNRTEESQARISHAIYTECQ